MNSNLRARICSSLFTHFFIVGQNRETFYAKMEVIYMPFWMHTHNLQQIAILTDAKVTQAIPTHQPYTILWRTFIKLYLYCGNLTNTFHYNGFIHTLKLLEIFYWNYLNLSYRWLSKWMLQTISNQTHTSNNITMKTIFLKTEIKC